MIGKNMPTNEIPDNFWIQSDSTQLGEGQKKITELSGSASFCILPWIHMATRPNGDMRLCCVTNASGAETGDHEVGLVRKENGQPANFGKDLPLSAWNNTYMKSVRTTMLEGKIPASCTKCFKEEKNGVVSKRVWETHHWFNEGIDPKDYIKNTSADGSVPEQIQYLDLRLGHTCNLKCVMCSPHDSSRWLQDYDKMMDTTKSEIVRYQIGFDKKKFNNTWYEEPGFWEQMYNQIPNLKQVYFAGGEPLMIKEHKRFLEEMIRRGHAHHILIRYSSNALLLDEDVIKLWKHFKQIKFAFSLDAIEDRNYYIRFPTDWSTVEKNMRRLDETDDNVIVSIATAIQAMNALHLPDFVKWKVNQKFKKINMAVMPGDFVMGGGLMNVHLLYIPTFLSAKILPKELKQELSAKLTELKDWLWINHTQSDSFWNTSPYGWKRWEAGLRFIEAEDHSNMIPDFAEYVKNLDKIRGTDFAKIFPELGVLL
jgi:pyruvate-formate lyase-activating enzyme